jgi:hypothetical protein
LASSYGVIKDRGMTAVKGLLVPFYKVLVNGQVNTHVFLFCHLRLTNKVKSFLKQKYPVHELYFLKKHLIVMMMPTMAH